VCTEVFRWWRFQAVRLGISSCSQCWDLFHRACQQICSWCGVALDLVAANDAVNGFELIARKVELIPGTVRSGWMMGQWQLDKDDEQFQDDEICKSAECAAKLGCAVDAGVSLMAPQLSPSCLVQAVRFE